MIFLDLTSRVKVFIWFFMSGGRIYIYLFTLSLFYLNIIIFFSVYILIFFSFMSSSNFNNCSSELPIIFHQVKITLTIFSPHFCHYLYCKYCLSLSLMLLLLWFFKIRKVAEESTGCRSNGWWEVNWDRWDYQ